MRGLWQLGVEPRSQAATQKLWNCYGENWKVHDWMSMNEDIICKSFTQIWLLRLALVAPCVPILIPQHDKSTMVIFNAFEVHLHMCMWSDMQSDARWFHCGSSYLEGGMVICKAPLSLPILLSSCKLLLSRIGLCGIVRSSKCQCYPSIDISNSNKRENDRACQVMMATWILGKIFLTSSSLFTTLIWSIFQYKMKNFTFGLLDGFKMFSSF